MLDSLLYAKQIVVRSVDSLGTLGIVTSTTLNMVIGQTVNQWLTVIISLLTIAYLAIKIRNEVRKGKQNKVTEE